MKLRPLTCLLVGFLVACGGSGAIQTLPSPIPTGGVGSPGTAVSSDVCHVGSTIYCVLNPDVTQATIRQTICVSGWTATIRPTSAQVTAILGPPVSGQERDHRMPLELGGAPAAHDNLSYEPNYAGKDSAENAAKTAVCSGGVDLSVEQAAFVSRWLAPYPGYK